MLSLDLVANDHLHFSKAQGRGQCLFEFERRRPRISSDMLAFHILLPLNASVEFHENGQ